MTVPALSLASRPDDDLGAGASAGAILELAARDDFHRWEHQLAATGHCASPIRLQGRIDAIDRATGQVRTMYDTDTEPGQVLLIACGNRREHVCPACSGIYKKDAQQIIRSGLTGGKGIPETVTGHPCAFATLTAPGFGPVHTTRTGKRGQLLPCRPRRDASQRRCPHGRDISCPRHHQPDDPRLGKPMCPDCYDYTGHVLFNALAPELWRRFTIYLPRQLARLSGVTQKHLCTQVTVRFVKVAEYQARGIIHYHAIIRLDAPGDDYQPPPARYDTALLKQAIRRPPPSFRSTSLLTCRSSPAAPLALRPATRARFLSSTRTCGVRSNSGLRPTPGPFARRATCVAALTTSGSFLLAGNWASAPPQPSWRSTSGPTCSATAATSSPNPAATRSPSRSCARPAPTTGDANATPTARKIPGAATSASTPS